jgi:methyl-accepting chemotaxis protein
MRIIDQLSQSYKIGTRIAAGFAVVIALLAIVSATAYFGLTSIRSNFSSYSRIAANRVNVLDAFATFQEMRRSVLTYLRSANPDDLKVGRDAGATARKMIDDYTAVAILADAKQLGIEASGKIGEYLASVDRLETLYGERKHTVDEVMEPFALQERKRLTAIYDGGVKDGNLGLVTAAGKAMEALMLMRIRATRYLASHDAKEVEAFEAGAKDLNAAIGAMARASNGAELSNQIKEFAAGIPQYVDNFHDVVKLLTATDGTVNKDLRDESIAIDQALKKLKAIQTKNLEDIKDQSDRTISTALLWCLGVAAAALGLGCLIAWFIGRSISRPVIALSGTMAELTAGHLETEVPGAERGDEIGDMAKAVLVFRDGAIEKNKMEAEAIKTAAINLRVRSALDAAKSNMMIADENYNIVYVNTAMAEMLRATESDIRKALPHFDSAGVVGQNIDSFHKNPAHQRGIMNNLTGAHEVKLKLGSQHFHLTAVPIVGSDGKRAGAMVEWRNETADLAIQDEVDHVVKAAVEGDLTQRVAIEGKHGFMLKLSNAMNALCDNFANFVAEVGVSAREVSNAAAEISASTTDLSQRTEEQAASLEQTSASMEQISSTVKKNAGNAQHASQLTSSSRDVADRGGVVVADAVKAMARIEESSRKIADIITVIDEIARQTNLLALNAAVEAARAGDAGRGFAVVASEVRSLAQRSSQAAKDIKDLITNSSTQVQDGVGLVNQAGTSLNEIVGAIKQVVDIVADIATASAEQAQGLEQINKALGQMDEVTQQNSALVEENAASAKALEHQSTQMNERVATFRLDGARAAAGKAAEEVAREPRSAGAAPTAKAKPNGGAKAPAVAKPAAKPAVDDATRKPAVSRMQGGAATALKQEPDWKEF